MTATQRLAWFNLAVVLTSLGLVVGLWPVLGKGAQGGFGVLGLLGLGPFFLRRSSGSGVVSDERDAAIQRGAVVAGYSVFWLVFVATCVMLPVVYGWDGAVPVVLVQAGVFAGVAVIVGVTSLVTLILYGRGEVTGAA